MLKLENQTPGVLIKIYFLFIKILFLFAATITKIYCFFVFAS